MNKPAASTQQHRQILARNAAQERFVARNDRIGYRPFLALEFEHLLFDGVFTDKLIGEYRFVLDSY